MQESPDLKPDWLEKINSLSVKNSNILLKISCSNILPQIGSNETGQ